MPDLDPGLVFLSYSHRPNLAHATVLDAALQARGIRTFRDETDLADGEPFPAAIIDALFDSKVIVLFLGQEYFDREFCRWEFQAAIAPGLGGPGGTVGSLDHLVIARPADRGASDELDRLPPEIANRGWPRANELDDLVKLVEAALSAHGPTLAGRLGARAAKDLRYRLLEGSEIPLPMVSGAMPRFPRVLPPSLGDGFVGRASILRRLDFMLRTRYGTPEATQATTAIEGVGGSGKTRLALEYAYRYGDHYPGGIFWVDGDTTPEYLEEQFHGVLEALDPSTPALVDLRRFGVDVRDRLAAALTNIAPGTPTLYIVDGPPEPPPGTPPATIMQWCPAPGFVTILVAARLKVSLTEGIASVDIPELPSDAAVMILTETIDRGALLEEDWFAIVDWVGRLPLALVLLNRALRLSTLTPAVLRDVAKQRGHQTEMLDREMEALRDHVPAGSLRGVSEAFALSYSLLTPEAQHLARLIAHIAPAPVPRALVEALGREAPPRSQAALTSRSFVTGGLAEDPPIFGRMHIVLADFLRCQSVEPLAELHQLIGPLHAILLPDSLDDPMSWPVANATSPLALSVADALDRLGSDVADVVSAADLRTRVAQSLFVQGDLARATGLRRQVADALQRSLPPSDPGLLLAEGNLGIALAATGDLVGALRLQEKGFLERRKVFGSLHRETIKEAGNVGISLFYMRRFDAAVAIQEWVLEASVRQFGDDDLDTLRAADSLANTLAAQDHKSRARKLQETALAASRRLLGDDHPETLAAMNNLSNTLAALGDIAGSFKVSEEALARSRRVRGSSHPDTARAAGNHATNLGALGDFSGALTLEVEVIDVFSRTLGPDHPETLVSRLNHAMTHASLGDPTRARELGEQVLVDLRRVLGEPDPRTVTAKEFLKDLGHGP